MMSKQEINFKAISVIIAFIFLFVANNAQVYARVINLRTLHNLSISAPIPPWMLNEAIQAAKPGDKVVCDSLIIQGDFDLNRSQIDIVNCSLDFQGTEFKGNVKCENVFFKGSINFSQATFYRSANFSGVKVQGQATFTYARFESMANFMNAKFLNATIFKNVNFKVLGHFNRAEFQGWVDFSGSEFKAAGFPGAQFLRGGQFKQTEFHGMGDFIGARADKRIDFGKAKFKREAQFWGVAFLGGVNFSEVEFSYDAGFLNSEFQENIQFEGTKFKRKVTFQNVIFNGKTSFVHTIFGREAIFSNTKFLSGTQFVQIEGNKAINFNGANFQGNMIIDESRFYGDLALSGAVFGGNALIGGEFSGLLNLKNTISTKRLDLQKVSFSREEDTEVTGIILEQALFTFLKSHWSQIKDWLLFFPKNSEMLETSMVSKEFGEYKSVSAVYSTLQNQYRKFGQQEDLLACYYDFKEYERLTNYEEGDWFKYSLNSLFWLSSGYSTNLLRLMFFGTCVVCFFAFLFSQEGAIQGRNRNPDESVHSFMHYFFDGLSFSVQAFTHIRYNHHQPSNKSLKLGKSNVPFLDFQRLFIFESIIGWVFFILLLLTVVKISSI